MKNWMQKFADRNDALIGESRFVFLRKGEDLPPAPGGAEITGLPAPEIKDEISINELGSLAADLQGGLQAEAEEAIGETVDRKKSGIDKLSEQMAKLVKAWSGTWDKLIAIAGAIFGMKPSDVDEVVADIIPRDAQDDPELDNFRPAGEIVPGDAKVSKNNRSRALHAEAKLREHPDWRGFIGRSAKRHGFPVATLTAFIEAESGFNPNSPPVYKDEKGKTVRETWMPKSKRIERGLRLITSAHGLAQTMHDEVPGYVENRYQKFLDEIGGPSHLPANPDPEEMMYNPEIAIDFAGWHLNRKIAEANTKVRELGLDPGKYGLRQDSPVALLYMSYNNGGAGYAVLRRYIDNPSPENFASLYPFQKEPRTINGRATHSWETRANYAGRVAEIARSFDSMPSTVAWAQSTGTRRLTTTA